jgi:peptidoglycan hydrolase-like protein with peptidoglycan-binding domain
MAATAKGPDGTPRAEFHIASTAHKLLTVNGYDAGAWFAASAAGPGEPRLLKPALPPMRGGDVTAVQHALAAAHIAVAQNGVYTAATAGAVARFQKQSGLDVDGVVDAETRRRLGLSAASPRQRGRN